MINYVRIPVAFSLLLLLAFFPLILGLSEPEYHRASGLTTQPYLWRWLAVTGVLFAGSAVIYALRCRRAATRARKQAAARTRAQQTPPAAGPAHSRRRPPPRTPSHHPPPPVPASTSGTRPAPPRTRAPLTPAEPGPWPGGPAI